MEQWRQWFNEHKKDINGRLIILDTNVLIDDPLILDNYPNDSIIISEVVIQELDKLKKNIENARYANSEIHKRIHQQQKNIFIIPMRKYADYVDDILIDGAEIAASMFFSVVFVTGDKNLEIKAYARNIKTEFIKIKQVQNNLENNVCPNCGTQWKNIVKVCLECHTPLVTKDEAPKSKICPKCKARWKPLLDVCLDCGTSLIDYEKST